jgi:hypothetical protein
MVAKMGRGLAVKKEILCFFDTTLQKASSAGATFV